MAETPNNSKNNSQSAGSKIRLMALMAMLVAVLAVCAQIAVPVGQVPITAQTAAVMLVALLLPPKYSVVTLLVYVLAGGVGLPVFANFKAGFGVLLGPTGGYIYGFVAAAFLVSAIAGSAARGRLRLWRAVAGCVVGLVFLYGFGAVQLKLLLDLDSFAAAFALGGIPYLFFEPLKIGAAVAAAQMLRQRLGR